MIHDCVTPPMPPLIWKAISTLDSVDAPVATGGIAAGVREGRGGGATAQPASHTSRQSATGPRQAEQVNMMRRFYGRIGQAARDVRRFSSLSSRLASMALGGWLALDMCCTVC